VRGLKAYTVNPNPDPNPNANPSPDHNPNRNPNPSPDQKDAVYPDLYVYFDAASTCAVNHFAMRAFTAYPQAAPFEHP
jgi:hypothetical protein